jgi:hypothetical protein
MILMTSMMTWTMCERIGAGMSDSFELLIDHDASPDNAAQIGKSITDTLIAQQIVLPSANSICVLNGNGFPPGPRLQELYCVSKNEGRFWDLLTNGVKLHTERYVNFFGFPVYEHSACPTCHERFANNSSLMDRIYDCVAFFVNDGRLECIYCPSCAAQIRCDHWISVPDIGFCHLAIEFWNWPPFSSDGWKISIPDLLSGVTGRNLAQSWGRL